MDPPPVASLLQHSSQASVEADMDVIPSLGQRCLHREYRAENKPVIGSDGTPVLH